MCFREPRKQKARGDSIEEDEETGTGIITETVGSYTDESGNKVAGGQGHRLPGERCGGLVPVGRGVGTWWGQVGRCVGLVGRRSDLVGRSGGLVRRCGGLV